MGALLEPPPKRSPRQTRIEPLENGDRLTAEEFLRRYEAMPQIKKAELIEGIVYMPSPVRYDAHAKPDIYVHTWAGLYAWETPGVDAGSNGTVKLDIDNVPQPDTILRITEECGGNSRVDEKGYLVGPPEMVIEVTASSQAIDLHAKLSAYRRNGIKEYLVWRTIERGFDWFLLVEGNYEKRAPDAKGLCHSTQFPGLVMNVPGLLDPNGAAVSATLRAGLKSKAHRAFVAELASRRNKKRSFRH